MRTGFGHSPLTRDTVSDVSDDSGGQRLVGYDNERGKGDHKHILDIEKRYKFTSIEKLVSDFLSDVERVRNEQNK